MVHSKSKHSSPSMVEQFYASFGPFYNFVYGKMLFDEGRRVAIDFLELRDGQKVLEVGVGTGLALPIYPNNVDVIGIDLSESMLKEARTLIKNKRLQRKSVQYMNANKLEFPDNSFDGVLGNLFISATSDPVGALEEMKRVCKPGGHLVLMNHFRSENIVLGKMETLLAPMAKSVLGFNSALDMQALLGSVNLKVKDIERVNFLGFWTAVSMINDK